MKGLGLRTFKTAISVFLAMFLGEMLDFAYPFHAAIAAMFAMDKTIFGSLKLGRNRIVGSIIGASIGILCCYIDRGNPLLCALAIALQIMICNALKLKGAIIISGIMMLIIMGNPGNEPLYYGAYRTIDTIIGVVIALLVNITICPYNSLKRLDDMVIQIWEQTDRLVLSLREGKMIHMEEINAEFEKIGIELTDIKQNFLFGRQKLYVEQLQKHYQICSKLLLEANICLTIDKEKNRETYDYHLCKALQIFDAYIDDIQENQKN